MSKKKRTKVSMTKNTNDFNRSFNKILNFVDNLTDEEVDKMLGE